MFYRRAAIAATAAVLLFAGPAAAAGNGSVTLLADVGRDADALSDAGFTPARIIDAAEPQVPLFDTIAGTAAANVVVEISLDAAGRLVGSRIMDSSGNPRLDRSALDAVRASRYAAAIRLGKAVAGHYAVDVAFDLP